ncbi:hypothetical protein KP509_10G062100 [Ceratopteris richardii]|nr:hypothetical protein KP509_10G062100 [Ceratopteris richardii]
MESTGSVNENLLAVMRKLKREKELGESERLLYENIAWQAVLCKCMFRNFENPSFNVKHTALFKELVTKKKGRFRYYMSVKDMDPHDLYSQDKSFFEFVHDKRELLRTVLIEDLPFFTVLGAKFSVLAGIPSKFLKLGHRVWCLHKLAFAYEPDNAKIVNVREDSVFEEDHMFEPDDIRPQEDPHASSPRTVALMTVPGFTLGNSIIRAKVCCIQSLTP